MAGNQNTGFLASLTRPLALGWHMVVILAVFPVFTGYLAVDDTGLARVIDPHLFDLIGSVTSALVFALGHLWVVRSGRKQLAIWQTLGWWMLTAAISMAVQFLVGGLLGGLPAAYYANMGFGLLSNIGLIASWHALSIGFAELAAAARELAAQRATLKLVQRNLENSLADARQAVSDRVNEVILPLLDDIASQLRSSGDRLVLSGEILAIVDQKVRPLSHELADAPAAGKVSATLAEPTRMQAAFAAITRRVKFESVFNVGLAGLAAFCFVVPSHIFFEGPWLGLIGSVPAILVMIVLGTIAKQRVIPAKKLPLSIALLVDFAFALGSAGLLMLNWLIMPTELDSATAVYLATQFFMVVALSGVLAIVLDSRWSALTAREAAAAEVQRLILRLQVERALQGRKLAQIVHGRVQATLQAISLRLHSGAYDSPEAQRQLAESLTELGSELALQAPTMTDLRSGLEQLRDLWDGLCEVKIAFGPTVDGELQYDPQTTNAVLVVAEEAITNAVKHAGAERILIQIEATKWDTTLVATNDIAADRVPKQPESTTRSEGFGSKTYDSMTKSWNLQHAADRATLTATF